MTNQTKERCGDCIRCLTDGPCLNTQPCPNAGTDFGDCYAPDDPVYHKCGCRKGLEGCFSPLHPAEDKDAPLELHACTHDLIASRCSPFKQTACVHETTPSGSAGPFADLLSPAPTTAQQRFDALYISSLEIAERLGVSRPAVLHARTRGVLPDPVCVNGGQIYIWERKEVEPYLAAWETSVRLRRGETVTVQQGPGNPFLQPLSKDA